MPQQPGKRLCFYDNTLSVDEEITRYLDFQLGEMAVAGESSFAARLGGYGKSGEWLLIASY